MFATHLTHTHLSRLTNISYEKRNIITFEDWYLRSHDAIRQTEDSEEHFKASRIRGAACWTSWQVKWILTVQALANHTKHRVPWIHLWMNLMKQPWNLSEKTPGQLPIPLSKHALEQPLYNLFSIFPYFLKLLCQVAVPLPWHQRVVVTHGIRWPVRCAPHFLPCSVGKLLGEGSCAVQADAWKGQLR